jgi:hypothetical protein
MFAHEQGRGRSTAFANSGRDAVHNTRRSQGRGDPAFNKVDTIRKKCGHEGRWSDHGRRTAARTTDDVYGAITSVETVDELPDGSNPAIAIEGRPSGMGGFQSGDLAGFSTKLKAANLPPLAIAAVELEDPVRVDASRRSSRPGRHAFLAMSASRGNGRKD